MKKTFAIPDDKALIAAGIVEVIVEKIPDEWGVVRGTLRAPKHMFSSGEVSVLTKLVFAVSIDQMICGIDGATPDIFEVLIEGKKPAEVHFGERMGRCEVMPMSQSKKVVKHFLRLGYRGRIMFASREVERMGDPYDDACNIWIPIGNPQVLPKIDVNVSKDDGYIVNAEAIIKFCSEIGLIIESTEE